MYVNYFLGCTCSEEELSKALEDERDTMPRMENGEVRAQRHYNIKNTKHINIKNINDINNTLN